MHRPVERHTASSRPYSKQMLYHGKEVEFSIRHALAWQGEMQFELVEPLAGPASSPTTLPSHSEGLHHIGQVRRTTTLRPVGEAIAAGFVPLQSAQGSR